MFFRTIQKNFFFLTLPVISFISILLFFIIQWNSYVSNHELLLEKLDFQLNTQSFSLQILFWNIDDESISSILDLLIEDQDIIGVSLFDERDKLYTSRGIINDMNMFEIEEWSKNNTKEKQSIKDFFGHITKVFWPGKENFQYYTKSLPLYFHADGNQLHIGTFYLVISDESYQRRFRNQLFLMFALISSILVFISMSIVITYRSVIGTPLSNLKLSIIDARSKLDNLEDDKNLSKLNEIEFLNSIFNSLWTGQKSLERELIQSKKKFETYIREAPIPILIMNTNQQVLDLNDRFIKLYGYTLVDLPTEDDVWISFFPDLFTRDRVRDDFQFFPSTPPENKDNFEALEAQIVAKDGTKRFVEFKKTQIGDISIISVDDISNRKSIEREKASLLEQLNHRGKMDAIGQLAGGMAHDFNNVLTGIMSAAQLLQHPDRKLDQKSSKYVNIILKASMRAADLIQKLMVFSRKENLSAEVLDIYAILSESVDILKSTIDKRTTITLTNKADNVNIWGHSSSIENAIINLGINASHALNDGGSIQFSTDNIFLDQTYCDKSSFDIFPGNYLKIAVIDNGCGITKEIHKKIFEPFFTTKEQGKGTGLGLAAVYGTVQNHKGEIKVSSELGIGTTFELFFPSIENSTSSKEIESQVTPGYGTVLFVDDEDFNRSVGKDVLESLGYNVILAENGLQAVSIFREKSADIDITILDMVMPLMNGSEAFYKMREIDESCKIIIASGHLKNANISSLMENGLLGYIQKPYKTAEISALFQKSLSGAKIS